MSKKPPIFRIKTLSRPVPDTKTNELLAVGFANDAEGTSVPAQQLEDFRSFGPRYFLFCHALELLLKAQILATGADHDELFEIRHDLEKAYSSAIELDTGRLMIVRHRSLFGSLHTIRITPFGTKRGYLIVPTAEDLVTIFRSMHLEIEATVRAAYLKRKRLSGRMPADRGAALSPCGAVPPALQ